MATLTLNGDVYVDTDTSTTERFTEVTLTSVGVDRASKAYPQALRGMAGLEQPIAFEISRRVRKKLIDDVLDLCATFVARQPRRTLDGFIDAVVNDGAELVNASWTERDRRDDSTYTQSESGFLRLVDPTVRGDRESLTLVLYPVNRLRFVNSTTYLSDADYN